MFTQEGLNAVTIYLSILTALLTLYMIWYFRQD